MLRIAGQTAGQIGLTFSCGHSLMARGCKRKKINFFPRVTPGLLASSPYRYRERLRAVVSNV